MNAPLGRLFGLFMCFISHLLSIYLCCRLSSLPLRLCGLHTHYHTIVSIFERVENLFLCICPSRCAFCNFISLTYIRSCVVVKSVLEITHSSKGRALMSSLCFSRSAFIASSPPSSSSSSNLTSNGTNRSSTT
jgi:hypothetical protein